MITEDIKVIEKLDEVKDIIKIVCSSFENVAYELSEVRATMLVNFGKNKKTKNSFPELLDKTMTATQMIIKIMEYFMESNFRK